MEDVARVEIEKDKTQLPSDPPLSGRGSVGTFLSHLPFPLEEIRVVEVLSWETNLT